MTELTKKQMVLMATAGVTASQMLRAGCTVSQMLDAGFTMPQMLRAGCTASQMIDTGFTASQMIDAGFTAENLKIENLYTTIHADIKTAKRKHDQSTFGDNICGTPMCIAGHIINVAGEVGYKLREKLSPAIAAALIHAFSHPDKPCPNFGAYPDEWALAFIEDMADYEKGLAKREALA